MKQRTNRAVITIALLLIAAITVVASPPSTVPAAAHHGHWSRVWVGSPISGSMSSPAAGHHLLSKGSPAGDFATDVAGTGTVKVYAAISNADDSRLRVYVHKIIDDNACRLGGGGDMVTVRFAVDGTTVGYAHYAHLDRASSLYPGKEVGRWGGSLGTVATNVNPGPAGSDCWTGPHVHMELSARWDYACYNGWKKGDWVSRTRFMGFVSGSDLARYSRRCP